MYMESAAAYTELLPERFSERVLLLLWRLPLLLANLFFARLLITVGFKTYTRN
jgi:hypothetical protein